MGMPGVSTWNFGEAFSHLYLDSVAMNHNSIGRGYETWGNGTAETLRRDHPCIRRNHGVVSPASAARRRRHLVRARQPELSGDRRAGRARLRARATPKQCFAISIGKGGTPGEGT